jgi:hypothetical protein
VYIHILRVVLFDSDRNFCKYLFYESLYYGGELAYYVFYLQIRKLHLICGYEQLSLILSEEIHHITSKGIM